MKQHSLHQSICCADPDALRGSPLLEYEDMGKGTGNPATAAPRPAWSVGSLWHRWDPHIHVPGTLLNDQFGADWDAYFAAVAAAQPRAAALGITDYATLRGY